MACNINDLKTKEVINISNGERLGLITDAEIDLEEGKVISLIIEGQYKMMGLFGKTADTVIKWEKINKIGSDFIFVDTAE